MEKNTQKGKINPGTIMGQTWDNHETSNVTTAKFKEKVLKNKTGTNLGQSWDKPGTEKLLKHDIDPQNLRQTWDKPGTQPETNLGQEKSSIRMQPSSKNKFSSLVGDQQKIMLFLYEECVKTLSHVTSKLSLNHISTYCNIKEYSARKAIQRLVKNNILIRSDYKDGPGGGTEYTLPESIYLEIHMLSKFNTESAKDLQNHGTQPGTTRSSRSSSNISTPPILKEGWEKIDVSELLPYEIYIGEAELINILKEQPTMSASLVQESINHLTFALKNHPDRLKKYDNIVGIFVSRLQKGTPWKEKNYVSPEEVKATERQKILNEKADKLKHGEFLSWFTSLKLEDLENIVPSRVKDSTGYINSADVIRKDYAEKHFDTEIWPSIRDDLKSMFEG